MNNEQALAVLQNLYTECHTFYLAYKKEQDKILYFAGTVFISIIALTGIFGAHQASNILNDFRWYHLLIFHTMFFILYLFYMHKMLAAEIYLMSGLETLSAIEKLNNLNTNQIPSLPYLKNRFLGDSLRIRAFKKGLSPGRIANILVFLLYAITSISPYVWLQIKTTKEEGLIINSSFWTLLLTTLFVLLFVFVDRNINKRRKNIGKDVKTDMHSKLDKFVQVFSQSNRKPTALTRSSELLEKEQ